MNGIVSRNRKRPNQNDFSRDLVISPVSGHFPYPRDFVVSPVFRHFWKRLEVKKVVRLQGWKVRRLEGWKVGRSEG